MGSTKRFLTGTLVVTFSIVSTILVLPKTYASGTVQFTVTAYYSPLPGQSDYFTGSYEGDKRLNGSGIITASGKEVFPGLIAAPRNYPFGTKIYIKGYGIGEVADRGGAIVNAGVRGNGHDRLDIWLGHGDAGLERARRWGRRTVTAKIVTPDSPVTLGFPETTGIIYENLRVSPDSDIATVRRLQLLLREIGYYSGETDGNFESVRDSFIDFQLKYNIIPGRDVPGAGHFGPRTVDVVRDLIPEDTRVLIEEPESYFYDYNNYRASEIYKLILKYGELQVGPDSSDEEVRQLQELLQELGEYSGSIDGVYENVREVLIDFQIKIGLIENRDDWGAGHFGQRTKATLWNYYEGEHSTETFAGRNTSSYSGSENRNIATLSRSEENQIRDAFPQMTRILENRARRNGDSLDLQLQQFKTRITMMTPQVTDPIVLARIDFLITLIDMEMIQL